MFSPNFLNFSALNLVWAYQTGTRIGWCVPEAGNNIPNLQVEFYPRLDQMSSYLMPRKQPFTFHRRPIRNAVTIRKGSQVHLYCGASGVPKVYEAGVGGTDDGATIVGMVEIGWFDFGMPVNSKYVRSVRIAGRGKFELQWRKDFLSSIAHSTSINLTGSSQVWGVGNWGVGTWGPDSMIKSDQWSPDVYGHWFALRFVDAEVVAGSRSVDFAGVPYSIVAGQWAVYEVVMQGFLLGDNR
jgi:hypothetical protein